MLEGLSLEPNICYHLLQFQSYSQKCLVRFVILTWLDQPDVQYLVHLAVVGRDVEHQLGVVGHAGDVDWHEVLANLKQNLLEVEMQVFSCCGMKHRAF